MTRTCPRRRTAVVVALLALATLAGVPAAVTAAPATDHVPTSTPVSDRPVPADFGSTTILPSSDRASNVSAERLVATVPLITGQTVTVVELEDGTRRYRVDANRTMQKVTTPDGDYVYPAGVDFDTFAPSLFNIEFLIDQGVTTQSTEEVSLIVQFESGAVSVTPGGEGTGVEEASSLGLDPTHSVASANFVAGDVAVDRLGQMYTNLQAAPEVKQVLLNPTVEATLDRATNVTNADTAQQEFDVSGEGITIAILDTGVNESHPDLDEGKEILERNFVADESTTRDIDGHGTHVAGIAAGTGDASNGTFEGFAPNASIIDARVLGADGSGSFAGIFAGVEFSVRNGADIVSMSLGAPQFTERYNSLATPVIDDAVRAGSLVVTSAGNGGPGEQTIGTPAIARNTIAVGATTEGGDGIVDFSSRGPTSGFFVKPDLVAPGENIASAASPIAYPDRRYVNLSGTSMSAPAVSGTAALVFEGRPSLRESPLAVKSLLIGTSDPLANDTVYDQGGGQINVTDALGADLVVSPGTLDFGLYTSNVTSTRGLTITNTAPVPRSVTIDTETTGVIGNATGSVTASDRNLTVPAGGTATVDLTLVPGQQAGVFSGRVTVASNGSETYSTSFGYARGHEVTVTKSALPGAAESTEGDAVFLQPNRFSFDNPRISQYSGGTIELLSLGGPVTVMSPGVSETTGSAVHLIETVEVTDDTTVRLDESDTVRYRVNASAVAASAGPLSALTLETTLQTGFSTPAGSGFAQTSAVTPGQRTVRFSEGADLNASIEAVLAPLAGLRSADATLDVPTAYVLSYSDIGVTGARTFRPDPTRLMSVNASYYRTSPDQTYSAAPTTATTAFPTDDVVVPLPLADRRVQTVRVSPGTAFSLGASKASEEAGWDIVPLSSILTRPNGSTSVTINEQPIIGTYLNWRMAGGQFGFRNVFKVDQQVSAYRTPDLNTFGLFYNGTPRTVLTVPFNTIRTVEPIGISSGTRATVLTVGRNSVQPLSNETTTTTAATYTPGGDNAPPQLLGVDVQELSLNSTVTADNTTVVVGASDASNLTATGRLGADLGDRPFDASADRLRSVREVSPGVFALTFDSSGLNERVDLAVRVADTAGNTVQVVTENAFRADTGPACVASVIAGDDGAIGLAEIQNAISLWAEGAPVPGVEAAISLREIQALISDWAEGRTVTCSGS